MGLSLLSAQFPRIVGLQFIVSSLASNQVER